jgi:hypothetical protein
MVASRYEFMHACPTNADQETKIEKKRNKVAFMNEITDSMFDKSGKALSKNIIPSGTTKRQVIV